jgi:hypothetical protein
MTFQELSLQDIIAGMATNARVTRLEEWPNRLGFDCTVNRCRFQVTSDRTCGRLIAIRENRDKEITHSIRLCDSRGATWDADNRNVAKLVYAAWNGWKNQWTSHEDD